MYDIYLLSTVRRDRETTTNRLRQIGGGGRVVLRRILTSGPGPLRRRSQRICSEIKKVLTLFFPAPPTLCVRPRSAFVLPERSGYRSLSRIISSSRTTAKRSFGFIVFFSSRKQTFFFSVRFALPDRRRTRGFTRHRATRRTDRDRADECLGPGARQPTDTGKRVINN